jgi:hypothetical protein
MALNVRACPIAEKGFAVRDYSSLYFTTNTPFMMAQWPGKLQR